MNFQIFKLVLEKAEKPEIKLSTSVGSSKKAREFQENIYFCFIDYAKAFDCVDHNKLWKILKRWEYQATLPAFEKLVCRTRSNSQDWAWNNELVQNWESGTSRQYIIMLLI